MKNSYKLKNIIIIFFLLLVITLSVFLAKFMSPYVDMKEIKRNLNKVEVLYQSERGFGNDRLDIYGFTFTKERDLSNLKTNSEELDSASAKVEKLITNEIKDSFISNKIIDELNKIKTDKNSMYLIDENKGKYKFYIYNPTLNRGLFIILVI